MIGLIPGEESQFHESSAFSIILEIVSGKIHQSKLQWVDGTGAGILPGKGSMELADLLLSSWGREQPTLRPGSETLNIAKKGSAPQQGENSGKIEGFVGFQLLT